MEWSEALNKLPRGEIVSCSRCKKRLLSTTEAYYRGFKPYCGDCVSKAVEERREG